MAYRDIATRLILSTENVRKRIQQARGILRERLQRIEPLRRPANRTIAGTKSLAATNVPPS